MSTEDPRWDQQVDSWLPADGAGPTAGSADASGVPAYPDEMVSAAAEIADVPDGAADGYPEGAAVEGTVRADTLDQDAVAGHIDVGANADSADAEGAGESDDGVDEIGESDCAKSGGTWEPTGDSQVDRALAELDGIDQLPLTDHSAVYDRAHRRLQEILSEVDGEADQLTGTP